MSTEILFVGAHPDDVEIGAGGTVAKFAAAGHKVWICILTDASDLATQAVRQFEAVSAAAELGIPQACVIFCGLRDGHLAADGVTIATFRELMRRHSLSPSLVFTHASRDSHNDHVAAAILTTATFRQTVILHYRVLNSAINSEYAPRLFIDTTINRNAQLRALRCHKSQDAAGRILWKDIDEACQATGREIDADFAEAFEVTIQQGAESSAALLAPLNDCPFHRFWHTLVQERQVTNIHGIPVHRRKKQYNWPTDKDRDGIERLRASFSRYWRGGVPVREYRYEDSKVLHCLDNFDVLLSGGPVSNGITRDHFNHFVGIRYVIEYDMPDYKKIRILDREDQKVIVPEYDTDEFGKLLPRIDYGILTVMKSPVAEGRYLIGCMGIHGFGSYGCYLVLSERVHLRELLSHCELPLPAKIRGYQVLVRFDVRLSEPAFVWDSLWQFPPE